MTDINTSIINLRNAEIIAEEINQIKEHVRATAIDGAIRIGRKLKEAKSLVPYGEWENWLTENVNYSASTAQNLMRIAEEYGRKETQALADISYTQAVELLRLPAEEREQFVAEHDMESISTRELHDEIKRLNAEREKLQLTIDEMINASKPEEPTAEAESITMVDESELDAAMAKAKEAEEAAKAERERANDLEKALKSARKQVENTEQRLEEAAKARQKAEEERNAARKQAEADALKLKRTEEELETARNAVRTVEVLPEKIKEELDALRAKASRTSAESEMRAAYDGFLAAFNRLMDKLDEAANADAETAAKFRAAFCKATMQMAERMGE